MKIGINCLRVNPNYSGGLNTYIFGLLDGFAALGGFHRFRLYVTTRNQPRFARYLANPNFEISCVDGWNFELRKSLCMATLACNSRELYRLASDGVFNSLRKQMDAESDLIYTPTVMLQSFNNRKPTVLSMHDIQHVHYPEFLSRARRISRPITYGLSAQYANYFQASSDFIKNDILDHFRLIAPERVEVIPEGVNVADFAAPRDTRSLRLRYGLTERFLFYPAQLWPHKNHLRLLKALKKNGLRGHKIPLVMTGAPFGAASDVLGFLQDQDMDYVRYLGKVPFDDLVGLYQQAAFLVCASLYESNSLPVLEAAAAGTPIIASRIPPNEELARVLELNLFDPHDPDDLAETILALWNDEKTTSAQVHHNRTRIGCYSWENAARKYMRFFERVINA
jgi:glycosyltransferase involved in cell wall biosynthesis